MIECTQHTHQERSLPLCFITFKNVYPIPIIYVLTLEERIKLLTLFLLCIPRFEIHIESQIYLFLATNLRIHNNKKPTHIKHSQKQLLQQGILWLHNL